jgi:hypothetical protein
VSLPRIVQAGDAILRARAAEVPAERIGTPELQDLFATMIAAMRDAPGVGLAAPQIGVPLRVIVLEDRAEGSALEDFVRGLEGLLRELDGFVGGRQDFVSELPDWLSALRRHGAPPSRPHSPCASSATGCHFSHPSSLFA